MGARRPDGRAPGPAQSGLRIPVHIWGDCLYVEVPRSGCTSIITAFNPELVHYTDLAVHGAAIKTFAPDLPTLQFWLAKSWRSYWKFTVVREPIARFRSYYYGYRERDGLPDDINDFARDLPAYVASNKWPQHFVPQTWLIGEDLSLFDYVGRLERMDLVEQRLGRAIPHRFASKQDEQVLTEESITRLDTFYRRDFDVLGYERQW